MANQLMFAPGTAFKTTTGARNASGYLRFYDTDTTVVRHVYNEAGTQQSDASGYVQLNSIGKLTTQLYGRGTYTVLVMDEAKTVTYETIDDYDPVGNQTGVANVFDHGATGDGSTDDSTELQAALDSGAAVVYVPDGTFVCNNLTIPSDTTLLVDGVLKHIGGAVDTDAVLLNSDTAGGNSNITLIFRGGKIDGNKANQSGAAGTAMYGIYFKNVSYLKMEGVRVDDNYVPTTTGWNPGAIWIEDSDHIQIRDVTMKGYEGEGLTLDTCTYFTIDGVLADATSGNTDAWSGVQITGEAGISSYGTVSNVVSRYAGASGFNIDGSFIDASNIHVSDNVFNSAINIGHDTKASDHVTLNGFSVFNFATAGTGANDSGLSVVGGSTDINVSNGSIDGNSDAQADNGVYVGSLAARVNIANVRVENCAAQGFEFFESEVHLSNCYAANNGGVGFLFAMNSGTQSLGKQVVHMTGCTALNNTGFGLSNQQKDASNFYRIYAQNCDFKNTGGGGTYTSSADVELIAEGCEFLASDTVASAATIDVRGLEVAYITGTTAITAITMTTRQRCTLIFDASVTVTDGASLTLNGNTDYTATATDTLTVVERNGVIWEAGRSVN